MVSLSIALYLSTVVSGVAFAKPMLSTRQTTICTPTFNSVKPYIWSNSEPVGLSDGVKSGSGLLKAFGPGSLFKFTKVDSSSPSFYIQPFEDQNLAVALRPNSSLFLRENENEKNTRFIIECTECKEAINDNCFMKMANNPNTCVQIGNDPGGWRGAAGDPVFVASECKKQDKQRFNYFPRDVPIKPPASPPTTPPTNPPEQKICNPNFEFEGVRVANSAQYWGAPKFEDNVDLVGEGDFNKRLEIRFEQTGSPQAHYVAKSLNGTNLAVGVRESNGNLYFVKDADLNKDKYKFSIECKAFCKGASSVPPGDLPADGCTIKSLVGNRCVQLGNGPSAGNQGDRLFVRECDGTDSQRWNFLTSPFKKTGRPVSTGGSNTKANAAAAVGGDSDSVNLDVKTLITNSYVVIGLLAGIFIALVAIAVISTRGCFKGRSLKPKYTYVDASGKEIEALTLPSGRYSD